MKQYWIRVLYDKENSCRSRRLLSSTFKILHSHTQPHSITVIIKLNLFVIKICYFWTTFHEVFLADNWNSFSFVVYVEQKDKCLTINKKTKKNHFDEGFSWLRLSQSKVRKKKTGALIGSLRCHDGDGDKNVKKAIGFIRKTKLSTCSTLLCTFPRCHCQLWRTNTSASCFM